MSTEIVESLKTIAVSYVYLLGLHFIFWPLTKKIFGDMPDKGWSMARIFGVLVTSLTMWTLGHLGVGVNSDIGMIVVILLFLLWSIYSSRKVGFDIFTVEKSNMRVILMAEYMFLSVFLLIAFVRGYMPQLDSLEKFMDYGFINTYLRSDSLPAIDMWQAGEIINYYSFGHYWASVLIRFLPAVPAVGYNLVLGFVGGVVSSLTLVVVTAVSGIKSRVSMVGALLASLMMVFGGNGHTIWYLIKNGTFGEYWYADATRFIHNTIHEFPSYSLIVSDLHGHVLDLPVVLLFMAVLYCLHKTKVIKHLLLLGGLFGVMTMTNTWDLLIYGLLMAIYYLFLLAKKEVSVANSIYHAGLVVGTMVAVTAPWWLGFVPISNGILLVETRTPIWQLAVLWSLLFVVAVVGWLIAAKFESVILIRSVILTMIILIIIPELVYFKDIYPDHPRANTMFKLTYQSFVMSVIVFGVATTQITHGAFKRGIKITTFLVLMFVFGSSMIYPTLAYPTFYDNFEDYKGLSGEDWLQESLPIKSKILDFLRENDRGGNIVEAVGDSYTYKNLLSSYTGIPTIQGWRVHEWLWRGGYDVVAKREAEVREIYEGKDTEKTIEILKKYNIDWIIVGPNEVDSYLINHEKLIELGEVISFTNNYYIVEISD